jgi:hypothetical protein
MTKKARKLVSRLKRTKREGAQALRKHKRAMAAYKRLLKAYRAA